MTSANRFSGTLLECRTVITQYFNLKRENAQLALENARLQEYIYALNDSAYERYSDTASIGDVVVARVIDNSVRKDDNYITINKGRTDGVDKGMGIYNSSGVVGVVMLAGNHYSVVLPILNSRTSISCKVQGTDSFGFLEWSGGNPYIAQLMDLPYHSQVEVGDTLVTSGYSSVFPQGIPVGNVLQVDRLKNGMSLRVTVSLAVDMANLGWVYVYAKPQNGEIDDLYQHIR